ncbi:MAG: DHH family phosphoesterase [Christensenellales bacterium]
MKSEQKRIIEFLHAEDGFTILRILIRTEMHLGAGLLFFLTLRALGKKAEFVVADDVPFMYRTMPLLPYLTKPEQAVGYKNVICVDTSDKGRLETPKLLENAQKIVVLDHHISNQGFGDLQWIEPKAAASAEVIYQVAELLHVQIKGDLATCLLLALSTDTGHFGFKNTTPRTLEMASKLLADGASIADICYDVYHRKTWQKTKLLGRAIDSLELLCDGKAGLVTITKKDLEECGCSQSDCEGLIDIAREIDGVEVSVMLRERGDEIKGSLRSRNEMNVADMAAQYGGGGHRAASGFSLQMTLPEAVCEVKRMLTEAFAQR